jgi:MEMO1 family protein
MNNAISKLICAFCVIACFSNAYAIEREPAVAGMFYPSDSAELAQMVESHLDNVAGLPEIDGRIVALIVPHAGLVYSGQIAAYAYKLLENSDIENVILCGPTHRYPLKGLSVYGPGVTWKTPLGKIACNENLCNRLIGFHPNIKAIADAHTQEHCLEVQLPYLQKTLSEFSIIPIIMGQQDRMTIELMADALVSLKPDSRTVIVSSTDWQHYRPSSTGWPMDSLGIVCLETLDPERLQRYLSEGKVEACGGGSSISVIKAAVALGANRAKLLKYGDSGDLSGDKSKVVGYIAAVLYEEGTSPDDKTSNTALKKTDKAQTEEELPKMLGLSESEKAELLKIARKSVELYLESGDVPDFDVSDNLRKYGAAFVTLEKQGQLRGCIGHTSATEPLYKTVSICAVQAAVSDRRFRPVTRGELDNLHIEISVLSPMQQIIDFSEIVPGRDGLMIFKGQSRGLLLPQVASDYGWHTVEFLEQTCRKAGLGKDDYKSPDAVVYKFQALVFGE